MKKLYTLFAVAACLGAANASAQYITEATADGFDFSKATDYVVLFAPDEAIAKMGDNIKSNQNLDPDQTRNSFQYWVTDWDKTLLTLFNVEETDGTNSYGGSLYLNMTPLYDWGSGQFHALSTPYDLSMLSDDYVLHIGLRDFGNAPCQITIQIPPAQAYGYKLLVNADKGSEVGNYIGVGNIGHDSKWYYLDIPLNDLNDPEGDFGFEPDWTNIGENAFVIGFNKPTCSKYTTGAVDPATGLKAINITQLNSAAGFDSVFFYKADNSGVANVAADSNSEPEYFDLMGRRVSADAKGLIIVKTASGVKKAIR